MKAAPTFNRAELEAAMRLTLDEKAAMRTSLERAILRVYGAELEPVPEVESLIEQMITAFDIGRRRQVQEQLSTAMLQIATACVGPPANLRAIADGITHTYEDQYSQAGALQLSADEHVVGAILTAVQKHLGPEAAAGVLRVMTAHQVRAQAAAGANAKAALYDPSRQFVEKLWDQTPPKGRVMKVFAPAAVEALAALNPRLGVLPAERTVGDWIKVHKKRMDNFEGGSANSRFAG